MKKPNKTAWMIYMPDLYNKPAQENDAHYVEIQRDKRVEYDSSWREFEILKRPAGKKKPAESAASEEAGK